jgi:hypothetical protein
MPDLSRDPPESGTHGLRSDIAESSLAAPSAFNLFPNGSWSGRSSFVVTLTQ